MPFEGKKNPTDSLKNKFFQLKSIVKVKKNLEAKPQPVDERKLTAKTL